MSMYYFKTVLEALAYPGLSFEVRFHTYEKKCKTQWHYEMRVTCKEGTCNVTGKPMSWNGRWWRLSQHMTPTEIVLTAFKAVLTALEHEAREQFTYKGVAVLDSHIDVEELVRIRSEEKLDARPCPSCGGLNTSCPEGCGRDPVTGELDGTTLTTTS